MSQAVHLISNNILGYGLSESRCLPHSGTSAKSVAVLTLSSCSNTGTYSQVKIGSLKYASGGAFFVCRASSGGPRRNSDFSKQNRQSYSRNRNRHSEEKDNFENLDESELLTSKNGPLLSLSNTPKFQATASPGPREREIVELFRKVQAQLRERAQVKEEKKVESSNKGKGKESETVDSLLKLLRKHSIEQSKKKPSNNNSGDLGLEQPQQNVTESEDRSITSHNRKNKERSAVAEPSSTTISRPPSNFRRISPVPKAKFETIYSNESPVDSSPFLDLTVDKKKQFEVVPDDDEQTQLETEELEPELEQQQDQNPNGVVFDELSEGDSSDTENTDEEPDIKHEDLSSLKMPELRALAKSRGIKGFSKMKKGDLVELLNSK